MHRDTDGAGRSGARTLLAVSIPAERSSRYVDVDHLVMSGRPGEQRDFVMTHALDHRPETAEDVGAIREVDLSALASGDV